MANTERKPQVKVVAGGKFGDEGKGRVVDALAQDAHLVIRANGGANAGHTVYTSEYGQHVLHTLPSGIFNPQTENIIGAGAVLDIVGVPQEIKDVYSLGLNLAFGRLTISNRATLLFDYHKALDQILEESRGAKKIGTTGKGIGPAYTDRVSRDALWAGLLKDEDRLMLKLREVLGQKDRLLRIPGDYRDKFNPDYYRDQVRYACKHLGSWVGDTQESIWRHLEAGSSIVVEGAQGTLLDNIYGTYPNVTSSDTTVNGLLNSAGIPAKYLTEAWGVFKAYESRVGSGGFPTELKGETGDTLRTKGQEYGATTGRPRRVGWFDGVATRYSASINGFTHIAVTRLDILSGFPKLRICDRYDNNKKSYYGQYDFPSDDDILTRCTPNYMEWDGWAEDISLVREFSDLPGAAQRYIKRGIGQFLPGAQLAMIGVGAHRDAAIWHIPQ